MIEEFVITMNLLGCMGFAAALFYSSRIHKYTYEMSEIWLIFETACIFAAFWTLTIALEWADIYSTILDQIQQIFVSAAAALYLLFSVIVQRTFVRPR